MDLYLVRHAIAADADASRWPNDRDRPLTPEGEKRFRRAARGLKALGARVDVVLSSTYARAWRTAELLEAEAGWPTPEACEALEGGRSSEAALYALGEHAETTAVALVGHEPNMHELAAYLLTADPHQPQIEFGKGAIALLDVAPSLRPGSATLRWMLPPKVLRALDH